MKFVTNFVCLLFFSVLASVSIPAESCTEFFITQGDDIKVAGRTLDWPSDDGFVVINPRGISRRTLTLKSGEKPLKWVAKYGSVTFTFSTAVGCLDGMNEEGLTCGMLWLGVSKYPENDSRPTITTVMCAQYFLDSFKSVAEVIAEAPKIRITHGLFEGKLIDVHLVFHDRTGSSAVLEYIEGNLVIHHGAPLSADALANDPYSESLKSLANYEPFGGNLPLPGGADSASRFVRAANFLKGLPRAKSVDEAIDFAFEGIGVVAQLPETIDAHHPEGCATQWRIVCDVENKRYLFQTHRDIKIRSIDLREADFSETAPRRALDINADLSGDITKDFKILESS